MASIKEISGYPAVHQTTENRGSTSGGKKSVSDVKDSFSQVLSQTADSPKPNTADTVENPKETLAKESSVKELDQGLENLTEEDGKQTKEHGKPEDVLWMMASAIPQSLSTVAVSELGTAATQVAPETLEAVTETLQATTEAPQTAAGMMQEMTAIVSEPSANPQLQEALTASVPNTDPKPTAIQAETVQTNPVFGESTKAETSRINPAQTEISQTNPVQTGTSQTNPVQTDIPQTEALQTNRLQTGTSQAEHSQTGTGRTEQPSGEAASAKTLGQQEAPETPQNTASDMKQQTETVRADLVGLRKGASVLEGSVKTEDRTEEAVLQQAADLSETGKSQPDDAIRIKVAEPFRQVTPELAEKLADKISQSIANGRPECEIQLDPENLGRISIKLSMLESGIKVLLSCDNPKTLELLADKSAGISRIVEHNTNGPVIMETKDSEYWNQQKNATDQHSGRNREQEPRQEDHRKSESDDFMQQMRLGLYREPNAG
ncbi:MAG: flagellar hook-length control protein FliK [Hungatella sp.]